MCCFVFLKIQYLFYSPLDEDRFGGIEEEKRFREQGYVKIEESATCMVKKCKCLKRISIFDILFRIVVTIILTLHYAF